MNLNEFQRRAVQYGDGPVLVLAGPGSGKTTVITERIHFLINHRKFQPSKILVLTFTKAAAKQMAERFFQKISDESCIPQFMTIHALCYEIVRSEKGGKRLEIHSKSELDKLIEEAYQLLGNEMCMKKWQGRFDYVLVDEFQDTAYTQAKVIFLLAARKRNIMVVGDDDQSIYSFRGAKPEIFTLFQEEFTGCETIQLKVNYRSRKEIVRTAETLIKYNKHRIFKEKMVCAGTDIKDTDAIELREYGSIKEQALGVIHRIQELRNQFSYKDIAVLFRTKAQFYFFILYCKLYAIPVCCKEKPEYRHLFVVDDLQSYLKIINKEGRREDYLRIMNKPERNLERNYLNCSFVDEEQWKTTVLQADCCEAKRVEDFLSELELLRNLPPYLCIYHLLYQTGYLRYVTEYAKKMNLPQEELIGVLEGALLFSKHVNKRKEISEFLNEKTEQDTEGIHVLTMHGAKGLEFEVVFLPDLNEDVLPNKKAAQASNTEEERRLFYVALTRGKEKLYLSWVLMKNNKSVNASPFLDELIV